MRYFFSFFFILSLWSSSYAQSTATSLVPHYIYQFAQHIQKKSLSSLYRVHIIGEDKRLKAYFSKILRNKRIRGKKFLITQGNNAKIPKLTNMIYIAQNAKVSFKSVSDYAEGKSMLLVSFNQMDKKRVMINLLITKKRRLGFEINRANILNEGFFISDKIVLMGGTELDVAKLFKGAKKSLIKKELALQKSQKKLEEVSQKREALEKQNNIKIAQLKATQKEVRKLLKHVKTARQNLLKERKLFKLQAAKNKKLQEELARNRNASVKIKNELEQMAERIKEKNAYISKRENILLALNGKIMEKEKALNKLSEVTFTQGKQIKTQEGTIDTQQNILFLMFGALVLFLILILVIVVMYSKQHKISKELKFTLEKLKETQKELIESAKMASLGELVSGLAHEMNTPIGVAITGISVLQNSNKELQKKLQEKKLKESDLVSFFDLNGKLNDSVTVSLQKAAQLVRSFKQVSVDQQVETIREFDVKDYFNTILISLKSQFKHSKITLHVDIDENIVLNSYPGSYYQIVTNLINNSFLHAFQNREEGDIWIEGKIEEERFILSYIDNGSGVSEDNLVHIFEPFFTTKRAHGGTGLGLHIIYNLITQKLHGTIKAHSLKDEGLTLLMSFPLEI